MKLSMFLASQSVHTNQRQFVYGFLWITCCFLPHEFTHKFGRLVKWASGGDESTQPTAEKRIKGHIAFYCMTK